MGRTVLWIEVDGERADTLNLEADMAHAGMQPVFAAAKLDRVSGQYKSELDFSMPGDWVITITGGRTHAEIPVTVSSK